MSYTETVRNLLLHSEVKKACCRETELFLLTKLLIDAPPGSVPSYRKRRTSPEVFGRLSFLAGKAGIPVPQGNLPPEPELLLRYFSAQNKYKFQSAEALGQSLSEDCCKIAFLRAFFEISGTVTPPTLSSLSLDVVFDSTACCRLFASFAEKLGFPGGISSRRGKPVFYLKNFNGIFTFLALTGAESEALQFMLQKTEREVNNDVNRVTNCDMANLDRSRLKADAEAERFAILLHSAAGKRIPDPLRALAELRIRNPNATYAELGNLSVPPVSKSTVSIRMKKLTEILDKMP